MKQIWLLISLVVLFGHKTERKFTLGLGTTGKRKKALQSPRASVLLERSSLLFQASIQMLSKPNLGLNLTTQYILSV